APWSSNSGPLSQPAVSTKSGEVQNTNFGWSGPELAGMRWGRAQFEHNPVGEEASHGFNVPRLRCEAQCLVPSRRMKVRHRDHLGLGPQHRVESLLFQTIDLSG